MATKKSKGANPVKYRRTKPAKVYKNSEGKVVYKQSTDKVGDILVNQAGVKYTITGERFHAPTGYDDGKLKVRILQVKTSAGKSFEISDGDMQYYRSKRVLTRVSKKQKTSTGANVQSHKAAPKSATTYTVKDGRKSKTFATKGEAETCASQAKNRNVTITKGTKQPTHRIVNFTAKK